MGRAHLYTVRVHTVVYTAGRANVYMTVYMACAGRDYSPVHVFTCTYELNQI